MLKGELRIALMLLANSNVDYSVKDNEGMTFLEMFEACIKLPKIPTSVRNLVTQPEDLDGSFTSDEDLFVSETRMNAFESPSSAMSIFTWGSNNNYV